MKAIQIDQTNRDIRKAIESLRIVEKPIPKPKKGEVLVKIEAAPCNPSDLLFLQGLYGIKKDFPAVPGWEGAGTIVESGGGVLGWWLKGKRVACGGQSHRDGTWAEYYIAEAKACIVLEDKVSSEQGSSLIINPLTAIGMVEQAFREGHKALIQTAACSQVGRMVQALALKKNIPLINIVRRDEQVTELAKADQKWILSSEEKDFIEKLKELAKKLNATIAFEAIGGAMTGIVLNAMPPGSKVLLYGALSEKSCEEISPIELIFGQKKLETFWLTEWLKKNNFWHTFQSTKEVQRLIGDGDFQTKIRTVVGFDGWKSALLDYQLKMSNGKVILKPN